MTEETEDAKPWFLEEEAPRHAPTQHKENLPKPPEDAPALLGPLIQYVHEDMGLDELSLLDLRQLDPESSLGPNLIMLFATARSERHLHISSGRFVRWLRREFRVSAKADGLIGAGELKTKLRRLRKKAKLMGTNTAMIPGGDNGISTGWVCVNFMTDGEAGAETASFDESGRISGFGADQTGTTVVVQVLTEGRREELDLETLWKGVFRRSLEQQAKIKGEKVVDKTDMEKLVMSKLQIHRTSSPLQSQSQWDVMRNTRMYSTSARQPASPSLEGVRQKMMDIQFGGSPLNQASLQEVAHSILQTPSTTTTTKERLALLDQILHAGHESGLDIRSRDMLVHLIESLVTTPAYDEELGRAQKNLELLLIQIPTPPTTEHVRRLMEAYASRCDWDKVWDAFRTPTRFNIARSAVLYETAYRLLAESKDKPVCMDALRWMFPEMITENPPVKPIGGVFYWLRRSILVADSSAEEHLNDFALNDDLNAVERGRKRRNEFAKMLRDAGAIRDSLRT